MKQDRAFAAAYAAGVMDSDGTIGIAKHTRKSSSNAVNPQYVLRVAVTQEDGRCLDFLHGNFGGNVYRITKASQFSAEFHLWKWDISGPQAAEFLKAAYPFLRYKKDQAKVAVEFQTHIANVPWKTRVKPGVKGLQPLPEAEVAYRERCYQRLAALKHVFQAPRSVQL